MRLFALSPHQQAIEDIHHLCFQVKQEPSFRSGCGPAWSAVVALVLDTVPLNREDSNFISLATIAPIVFVEITKLVRFIRIVTVPARC